MIATGSLFLKQIRKSLTGLIRLPPITAHHKIPSAGSVHSVQSLDRIKNDDTKILIGFRAGFSASRQFSVGREKIKARSICGIYVLVRPVRFNADYALARVMHYRDNDKRLYSDHEEDIDRQLLEIDEDSSEDSSSDDDETAGPSVDALETQQTCVIDLRSR